MIRCREVLVKFLNQNKHGQYFRYTEVPGADYLTIEMDGYNTIVSYMRKVDGGDKPIKVVLFNSDNVDEVTCENSVEVV